MDASCWLGCTYEQQHLARGAVAGMIILVCFAYCAYCVIGKR